MGYARTTLYLFSIMSYATTTLCLYKHHELQELHYVSLNIMSQSSNRILPIFINYIYGKPKIVLGPTCGRQCYKL